MLPACLALLAVVFGCGGDDASLDASPDGGADARPDVADGGPVVSPIAPAALPVFDCPTGWRVVSRDDIAPGLTLCEPWAEDDARCAAHEMRLPGEPACRPVGAPCPADGWPADLPASGVLYVRAGATGTPDGSRDAPFPEIAPALSALDPSITTLALGPGVYADRLDLSDDLIVRGACAEQTRLEASLLPLRVAAGAVVSIESLSITSDSGGWIEATDLTLDGVSIADVRLTFTGERLTITDSVFRGGSDPIDYAIAVTNSADVLLDRVLIEDGRVNALILGGIGGRRTIRDVYVRNMHRGVALSGAELTVERLVIEDFVDNGLTALEGGEMSDVILRRSTTVEAIATGLLLGSTSRIRRLYAADAGGAVLTLGEGESTLRDVVIEGGDDAGPDIRTIEITSSTVDAERMAIARGLELAILATGTTNARFADLTVRQTVGRPTGWGRCLHAQFGATVTVERAVMEECTEAAVTSYSGARVTLRDLRVLTTRSSPCSDGTTCEPAAGIGLVSLLGGGIDAERFELGASALAGVMILEGADTDIRDGVVRDGPVGINVQDEAFDLGRVMDRVVFVGNGSNLDSSALPVPNAEAVVGPSP